MEVAKTLDPNKTTRPRRTGTLSISSQSYAPSIPVRVANPRLDLPEISQETTPI